MHENPEPTGIIARIGLVTRPDGRFAVWDYERQERISIDYDTEADAEQVANFHRRQRGWQGTPTDQTAQHLEGQTTFRLRVKIEQNSKSINQEFTAEVEGTRLLADMESDLHNALDACATQASRMVAYLNEQQLP